MKVLVFAAALSPLVAQSCQPSGGDPQVVVWSTQTASREIVLTMSETSFSGVDTHFDADIECPFAGSVAGDEVAGYALTMDVETMGCPDLLDSSYECTVHADEMECVGNYGDFLTLWR